MLLQFKIDLLNTWEPEISRTVLVPGDCSFEEFHLTSRRHSDGQMIICMHSMKKIHADLLIERDSPSLNLDATELENKSIFKRAGKVFR